MVYNPDMYAEDTKCIEEELIRSIKEFNNTHRVPLSENEEILTVKKYIQKTGNHV